MHTPICEVSSDGRVLGQYPKSSRFNSSGRKLGLDPSLAFTSKTVHTDIQMSWECNHTNLAM